MKHDILNVIYMKGKWCVLDGVAKKVIEKFTHREQAYHYAMLISKEVYVHEKTGAVSFVGHN